MTTPIDLIRKNYPHEPGCESSVPAHPAMSCNCNRAKVIEWAEAQQEFAECDRLREAINTHRDDVQCDGSTPSDTTAADVALWSALEQTNDND